MIRTIIILIALAINSILVSACRGIRFSEQEVSFIQLISVEEMNTKIRFWDLESSEVFKIGDSVHLSLENHSKEKVKFPTDYGVRIFTCSKVDKAWSEIKNGMKYLPSGSRHLSPKGTDSPGVIDIGLWPLLENEGNPIEIRVVVVGNVERNNVMTDEQVGAYLDLTLEP